MKTKPKEAIEDLDEVDRKWAADGAKVLARVAQGDCHLDDEGWWIETSTGKVIGIDPQTDRPILSEQEAKHWCDNARPFNEACPELYASIKKVGRPKATIPSRPSPFDWIATCLSVSRPRVRDGKRGSMPSCARRWG